MLYISFMLCDAIAVPLYQILTGHARRMSVSSITILDVDALLLAEYYWLRHVCLAS